MGILEKIRNLNQALKSSGTAAPADGGSGLHLTATNRALGGDSTYVSGLGRVTSPHIVPPHEEIQSALADIINGAGLRQSSGPKGARNLSGNVSVPSPDFREVAGPFPTGVPSVSSTFAGHSLTIAAG